MKKTKFIFYLFIILIVPLFLSGCIKEEKIIPELRDKKYQIKEGSFNNPYQITFSTSETNYKNEIIKSKYVINGCILTVAKGEEKNHEDKNSPENFIFKINYKENDKDKEINLKFIRYYGENIYEFSFDLKDKNWHIYLILGEKLESDKKKNIYYLFRKTDKTGIDKTENKLEYTNFYIIFE